MQGIDFNLLFLSFYRQNDLITVTNFFVGSMKMQSFPPSIDFTAGLVRVLLHMEACYLQFKTKHLNRHFYYKVKSDLPRDVG